MARDYTAGVTKVAAPVQLIGGWYDIFLPWMLEDFCALQAAGREVQLIIGPWTHTAPGGMAAGVREGLGWLRAHLLGDDRLARREPVRCASRASDRAEAGASWRRGRRRAPRSTACGSQIHAASRSSHLRTVRSGDRYRYDPSDPTPSIGGPVFLAREPVVDNRPLEARPDVVTYTTAPLPASLEAIGPVRVELYARADSPYFDLFARVCDADEQGASWNVCDALSRVKPSRLEQLHDGRWPCRASSCGRLGIASPPGTAPPSGLRRRTPALRPQPGHGRGPADGDQSATGHRRAAA